MRIKLSIKVFVIFFILSLVTMVMGILVNDTLQKSQAASDNIQKLNNFLLQLKELEIFNIRGAHLSYYLQDPEEFNREMAKAEELVQEIIKIDSINFVLSRNCGMSEGVAYYRQAASELSSEYRNKNKIELEGVSLLEKLVNYDALVLEPADDHDKDHFAMIRLFLRMEYLRTVFAKTRDPALIKNIRDLHIQVSSMTADQYIIEFTDEFVSNIEKYYLNSLSINDRLNYMIETGKFFANDTTQSIHDLTRINREHMDALKRRLLSLILFSFFLTVIAWLFFSQRLALFLRNQNLAMKSISAGHFDYELPEIGNDELGDLTTFTKQMALALYDKSRERQQSELEKEKLQQQLMQAQKIESIGILAGGIAHDFNNILTSILGYSEMCLAHVGEDDPIRADLKEIYEAGERAAMLTRQLLTFSRRQILDPRVLDLNRIIDQLAKMLGRIIGEDIILEIRPAEQQCTIHADPGQIEQVLMNLAVNARDAMPEGGRFTIETAALELDGSNQAQHEGIGAGSYVLLTASDTGVGMTPEIQKRIFEPFFTTKEVHKGTGLGLATVFGIINQHKGRIFVYSRPGQGTTFKMYLPAVDDLKANSFTAEEEYSDRRGNESILVVDDNQAICNLTASILEDYGYKIFQATSAADALEIIDRDEEVIHLLITDIIMPHMTGRDLAVEVRKRRPGIKIIFISGYTDQILAEEELVADRDIRFIAKPFTPATLSFRVRELLGHAAASTGQE